MNFLHDKHSRYYCIFIVTLVLLLFLMGIAVIDTQTAATKEMFLTHNTDISVCDVISMDAASVFRYNAVFVS